MIKEYLKNNLLITDGAMGTYYGQLKGMTNASPELANLTEPETIAQIHNSYINAGAKLIRTNTFAANSLSLKISKPELGKLIKAGFDIANVTATAKGVFVAADIGPIPESGLEQFDDENDVILDEYKFIIDVFLSEGADIFIFETFSSTNYLAAISNYIKQHNPAAYIIALFTMNSDGFTRRGVRIERIIEEVKTITDIDTYGFNCGVGPTHLYNAVKALDIGQDDVVAILPNAGYPEIKNERTVYHHNPGYFAEVMKNIEHLGVKILGGCCGTTPAHIKELASALKLSVIAPSKSSTSSKHSGKTYPEINQPPSPINTKKFTIAVELDPPFDTNMDQILHHAWLCKNAGVDIITIADSPMAKPRMDSIAVAAKIKREVGIETMPHICCRDKNSNALKSSLLAGYMEGLRHVLVVTGDPVPSIEKAEVKSVFNFNSQKLIEFIAELNKDVFRNDPYRIGGALNLNVINKPAEIARMYKKAGKGATFFLTQPIYSAEVIQGLTTIKRSESVKILAGLMPLVSYRNAQFLNNEIPGISIPAEQIQKFNGLDTTNAHNLGVELATDIASKTRAYVDGFYLITPLNKIDMVLRVIANLTEENY